MWQCTNCETRNDQQNRFCVVCGAPRPVETETNSGPGRDKDRWTKVLTAALYVLFAVLMAVFIYRVFIREPEDSGIRQKVPEQQYTEPAPAEQEPAPMSEPEKEKVMPYVQLLEAADTKLMQVHPESLLEKQELTMVLPYGWADSDLFSCSLRAEGECYVLRINWEETSEQLVKIVFSRSYDSQYISDGWYSYDQLQTQRGDPVYVYIQLDGPTGDDEDPEKTETSLMQVLREKILSTAVWVEWSEDPADSYVIPDSNSRYLSVEDLVDLTHEELCFARNEIFARHGWIFAHPVLAEYFGAKNWYVGTLTAAQFNTGVFNEYESANIHFIKDYEDKWFGGSYY